MSLSHLPIEKHMASGGWRMLTMSLLSGATIRLLPWKLPLPRGLAVLKGAQRTSHPRARAAASWGKWNGHRVCPVRIPAQGKEGKRVLFRARFLKETNSSCDAFYHRSLNCQLTRGLSILCGSLGRLWHIGPGPAWHCCPGCSAPPSLRLRLWHLAPSTGRAVQKSCILLASGMFSRKPCSRSRDARSSSLFLKANGRSWQDGGELCFSLYSSADRWTQPPNFRKLIRKSTGRC